MICKEKKERLNNSPLLPYSTNSCVDTRNTMNPQQECQKDVSPVRLKEVGGKRLKGVSNSQETLPKCLYKVTLT